jgi:HD-GYP domain-containing protein (c-di-GMP phosphodiesterase class II)
MAKKKLRISTRYKEIFQVISNAQRSVDGNFIWRLVNDRRKTFPVKIVKVDGDGNRIELALHEYSSDIQTGHEVYLKLDSRDAAFKAEVIDRVGAKVILAFPDEVVVNENRSSLRSYFHPSDEKIVQMKRVRNQVSSLRDKVHNALVFDVSDSGLSVFVPLAVEHFYDLRSRISVDMIGPYRLSAPIVGEVVFKMPVEIKGSLSREPGFKLGIQLDGKIPKAILDRFILKKQLFSITDEQVVRDEAFRRRVQIDIKDMKRTLSSKKHFKELFASLEVQRADNQYLKQHIQLLCEVLTGLGSKLGWVTDKTMEKLIYVAYLHDIRLVQHPKVARIQTKKEFDLLKGQLTEAERKAYLEAPAYAAEMARQDSEAYPDAIKILLQQKELPDGSGYPQGLTATLLAPLSCLFILSHFFVDYVMNHSDWTTEDFVKTYRTRLKGPYFSKIFSVMK